MFSVPRTQFLVSSVLLLAPAICPVSLGSEAQKTNITTFPEITLKDYRGKAYSTSDFKQNKFVVTVFLGTECPLAKLYGARLAQLAKRFEDRGVAFVGVSSNQQDSLSEIASYARRHQITFPVLKDLGNDLADRLKATRTPEVIVWDRSRRIRYRGRIDDQYGIGYIRQKATREDLVIAIEELLDGKPVTTQVTQPVGCLIGRRRKPSSNSPITYSKQIARIMQKRCVECHREGEIAPFTLTRYKDVAAWSEMIAEVVEDNRMPPWHADPRHGKFVNDRRLTPTEKKQILEWVRRGAPEGDPRHLPKPRKFIVGSQLPQKPDMELFMREKPFTVKAEGEIAYQNFVVDPGFKEDKWVTMAEALPGNRAVVHHIVVFIKPPDKKGTKGFAPGLQFLTTYVPGYRARPLPSGMAKWVAAGSQFVFQLHYTPIGTRQLDRSRLRLVFTKPGEVKHLVLSSSVQIRRDKLVIPAHAENHKSVANGKVGWKDARLLSMFPHMHLRGKSFRIDAKYRNGKQETLLNVPRYDFNWQTTYRLSEPRPIPKGTELVIAGSHDNSEHNLANPDPSKTVKWGDQTWDEMLVALFEWSIPVPEELLKK